MTKGSAKLIKEKTVNEIIDIFNRSSSFILVDYRGLSVDEMTGLRKILREVNTEIKVYKNTLLKIALNNINNKELDDYLNGPSALTFSSESLMPARTLYNFSKKHRSLELKAGIIDGKFYEKATLLELAKLPSKEELLAMLAGGMYAKIKELSIALNMLVEQKNN